MMGKILQNSKQHREENGCGEMKVQPQRVSETDRLALLSLLSKCPSVLLSSNKKNEVGGSRLQNITLSKRKKVFYFMFLLLTFGFL